MNHQPGPETDGTDSTAANSVAAEGVAGNSRAEEGRAEEGRAEEGTAEAVEPGVADADAGPGEADATAGEPAVGEAASMHSEPGRPETGETRVDAALTLLDRLTELPVTEHAAVFERVHAELIAVLGQLDPESAGSDD